MAGANKARNKDAGTRSKRRPRTVPVASRAHTQGGKPAGKGKSPAKGASPKPPRQRGRVDLLGYAIILFVLLAILWAVATPLRNYYSGRAEIARLEESITAKQAEKDRLLEEIDKYKSDAYIEQEARRRLGLVAEGETAYRIMDPHMNSEDSVTTDRRAEEDKRPWYEVLWDSIADDPALLDGSESTTGDRGPGLNLPEEEGTTGGGDDAGGEDGQGEPAPAPEGAPVPQ